MDSLKRVQKYWDTHHLGTQFLPKTSAQVGTEEYFLQLDKEMERWEYKNRLVDWIVSTYQNGLLLEVGCGLGHDLVKFAKLGLNVTGIELAKSVAILAKKHLDVYMMKGSVIQGNVENLSFPNERFDVVYASGVLQHTPDIKRAVNEIYRVIRKGGMAIAIVYYRYSWFNLLAALGRVNIEFEDEDPPITNTYSKSELYGIFSIFDEVEINLEYCYFTPTQRRGFLPYTYNHIFIPIVKSIPYSVMKNFGWHAIVRAQKY